MPTACAKLALPVLLTVCGGLDIPPSPEPMGGWASKEARLRDQHTESWNEIQCEVLAPCEGAPRRWVYALRPDGPAMVLATRRDGMAFNVDNLGSEVPQRVHSITPEALWEWQFRQDPRFYPLLHNWLHRREICDLHYWRLLRSQPQVAQPLRAHAVR